MHDTIRLGLAISHGTGPELTPCFEKVINTFARRYDKTIEISRSPRIYNSYASLRAAIDACPDDNSVTSKETIADTDHYEQWCLEEAKNGTKAIFRFSISAQALYDVRQRLEAIKFERFDQGNSSMLMVRDQAQGFYAGATSYDPATQTLSRPCEFRKDVMGRLVEYSIRRARQTWFNGKIDGITLVYKHHLFDGVLDQWAEGWSQTYGYPIKFVQPDTNNRNLLAYGLSGQQLFICGNEYADIVESFLLKMFSGAVQETSFSENVYLRPELNCLSEYQTVHGSADDIAGKGIVNPTATIKSAAAIMENHAGCYGLQKMAGNALSLLESKKAVTPDQGGNLTTEKFADAFLETFETLLQQEQRSKKSTVVKNNAGADVARL